MEGGVGEDGVELGLVGEGLGLVVVDCEGLRAFLCEGSSRFDHGGGGVDSCEDGSGGGELLGEGSVATAYVEDVFAGLRGEEGDYGGGHGGYEASVGGVGGGVPGLASGLCFGGHAFIVRLCGGIRQLHKDY